MNGTEGKERLEGCGPEHVVISSVDRAVEGVLQGFPWDKTKEGYSYWLTVYDNLKDISRSARHPKCHACGKEL